MEISNKIIGNIMGKPRARGGKNDWDGDGVPNRKDCQPRNTMRQDKYDPVDFSEAKKKISYLIAKKPFTYTDRMNIKADLNYELESAYVNKREGYMKESEYNTLLNIAKSGRNRQK